MVVQDRYSAIQNENVRLYHVFEYNGNMIDPPTLPVVTIIDKNGVDTLATVTSEKQSAGVYFADYFVPIDLPIGRYYDKWTFRFTSSDAADVEDVSNFEVFPKNSTINFSSSIVSQKFSNSMSKAVRDLGNFFIWEVMHLPVYAEQAKRTGDFTRYNFAYKNWNKDPKPIVRVNQNIWNDGWYCDYNGNIYFESALNQSDVVYADYSFSYFTPNDLAGFITMGVSALNSLPPPNSYTDIAQVPAEWWHGIMLYSSIMALRRIMLGMTTQEISIIFGDGERANTAAQAIKGLYEDYSEKWKEVSSGLKKKLPAISQIILPEHSMPGGRARWYRYMFVSGTG